MYQMSDDDFQAAIEEALDAMPEQFLGALANVAVVMEHEPSPYHLGYDEDDDYDPAEADDLLGLFDGFSLVERAEGYGDDVPDVITVFKGPHERCFDSREEIVDEIGKTVIHELGHYFGLEDDRLYDMGY